MTDTTTKQAMRVCVFVLSLGFALLFPPVHAQALPPDPSGRPPAERLAETEATPSDTGPDWDSKTGKPGHSASPAQPIGSAPAPALAAPDYFSLERKKIMRWNDQTKYIMVYIADGSFLPGWKPEDPLLVRAAFSEWEEAMRPRFHFIYMPDARGADVKVEWAARIGHNEIGEAAGINQTASWGKFISRNDIKLALVHPDGQIYPGTAIQSTALHEIGHMLGLKAHSDNPDDVMYPSASASEWNEIKHLRPRDIRTLQLVYESKPDYANPEGYHLSNFDNFKKTQKGHRVSLLWIPVPGVPFPIPIILPF